MNLVQKNLTLLMDLPFDCMLEIFDFVPQRTMFLSKRVCRHHFWRMSKKWHAKYEFSMKKMEGLKKKIRSDEESNIFDFHTLSNIFRISAFEIEPLKYFNRFRNIFLHGKIVKAELLSSLQHITLQLHFEDKKSAFIYGVLEEFDEVSTISIEYEKDPLKSIESLDSIFKGKRIEFVEETKKVLEREFLLCCSLRGVQNHTVSGLRFYLFDGSTTTTFLISGSARCASDSSCMDPSSARSSYYPKISNNPPVDPQYGNKRMKKEQFLPYFFFSRNNDKVGVVCHLDRYGFALDPSKQSTSEYQNEFEFSCNIFSLINFEKENDVSGEKKKMILLDLGERGEMSFSVGLSSLSRAVEFIDLKKVKTQHQLHENKDAKTYRDRHTFKKYRFFNYTSPRDLYTTFSELHKTKRFGRNEGFSLRIACRRFIAIGDTIIAAFKDNPLAVYQHKGNSLGYFLGGGDVMYTLTATGKIDLISGFNNVVLGTLAKLPKISDGFGYAKASLRITNCSFSTFEKLAKKVKSLTVDFSTMNIYLIGGEAEMILYLSILCGPTETGEILLEKLEHISYPKTQAFK